MTTLTKFRLERHSRRPGWTSGAKVKLADGMVWNLPGIDLALVVTSPELRIDLNNVLAIASFDCGGAASDASLDDVLRFHSRMAQVGVRLLQTNYDLPECCWKPLLSFDELTGMLKLTTAVAYALNDSATVWKSLLNAF